ncbi:MAG TPA: CHRD domain-containing protein, partial [Thermoanaerobaculia bacterium]
MARRTPFALSFALGLCLAGAAAPAAGQTFVFHLSGDQEVPPVPSPATGGCHGAFDGVDTLDLVCVHDVSGATLMHVHQGAVGVNGPPLFDLGDTTSPVTATWTAMTPGEIADLVAGNLYINIHTAGRPDGEIRGQILLRTVDTVPFTMDGSQVVPPNASAATGTCTADLSNDATGLQIDCIHDAGTADEGHVHQAPFGEVGPILHTFASVASPISELVPVSPEEVAAFAALHLYVELHSPDVPEGDPTDGVIRGQIGAPPAAPTTGTLRIRKATFPGGGTGFGFTDDVPGSPGFFTLDDGGVETFTGVAPGTYTVTEDDPGTTPGGYTLAHVECDDGDSAGNRFTRTATVALQAGETVTCTFENLELGGAGTPFVFHLSGDQEAPPVPSPSSGGCMGLFDAGAAEFTLVCTHDVVGATLMHIHRGAPGVNGPVVFDLGEPSSPVIATWTGMSPGDVADLLAGNLYVNIHTSGRPGGEIRGQIVLRSRDTFHFPVTGDQQVPPVVTPAFGECEADLNDSATALFLQCTHT